jgi:prophage tail gpP-like protein
MTAQTDFAAIEVDGLALDAWQGYSCDADLFSPADSFSLQIGIGQSSSRHLKKNLDELRSKVKPASVVKFYIGYAGKTALQSTGIADVRQIGNNASEGTTFSINGRDLAALLVDSACPLELYENGNSLMEVARKAIAPWTSSPWSLKVRSDAVGARDLRIGAVGKKTNRARLTQKRAQALGIPPGALSPKVLEGIDNGTISIDRLSEGFTDQAISGESNRAIISAAQIYQLRVKQAAPQAGETVWEFLDRHAKRLGVMMRMGPDGTLIFQTIDYSQAPLYLLERRMSQPNGNNIIAGGGRYDTARLYSQVRVTGRSKAKDSARSRFDVTIADFNDDAIPHEKVLLVHDDSIRSRDDAERRAYRELAKTRQGAYVLTYTLRGHGSDGNVFAVDTMCSVYDDVEGVKGDFYVIGRTFTRDLHNGARTELRLVPRDSIKLEAA